METVRIVKANSRGYATINASDFDPTRHVPFDAPKVADVPKTVVPAVPAKAEPKAKPAKAAKKGKR